MNSIAILADSTARLAGGDLTVCTGFRAPGGTGAQSRKLMASVYLVDGRRVMQCNIRDISKRKSLEARRNESNGNRRRSTATLCAWRSALARRARLLLRLQKTCPVCLMRSCYTSKP
jgi:hypothetical protein